MYLPFSGYETHVIFNPVALDLGESNDEALLLNVNVAKGFLPVFGGHPIQWAIIQIFHLIMKHKLLLLVLIGLMI